MTEKETKSNGFMAKFSYKGDRLLGLYYIFATFLFLNLCGVGYAYYHKFYQNKNDGENGASGSNQSSKVIVLPTDTIYVDKIDVQKPADTKDTDQSEDTKESLPVSHVERAREVTYDVKTSTSAKGTSPNISISDANAATPSTTDIPDNNASLTSANNSKPSLPHSTMKSEEESHTYLIALGTFKVKDNALNLIAELKQKGVEAEIISSNHFTKMPPTYLLVLGGKELSSATANQMCNDFKKKGIDCYVQDGGKYSWR
jgi:cell division septation protein DedD